MHLLLIAEAAESVTTSPEPKRTTKSSTEHESASRPTPQHVRKLVNIVHDRFGDKEVLRYIHFFVNLYVYYTEAQV